MKYKLLILAILFVSFYSVAFSQEVQDTANLQKEPDTYKVSMKDGSVYYGKIIREDDKEIVLQIKKLGKLSIPRENISEIIKLEPERFKEGVYWFENPNSTRYFISPTGYNLKAGEGYYQNSYVLFNSFSFGITDFLSFGGGFEVLSTFSGHPIFFVIPKFGAQITDDFSAGLGVLYVNALIDDVSSGFGLTYGVFTYGNKDNNLTAGLGYSIAGDNDMKNPIVTLSGMVRTSKNFGLVTENWIFTEHDYPTILSYGIRFIGETITVDLGFINNKEIADEFFIGIPYVDFVVKF